MKQNKLIIIVRIVYLLFSFTSWGQSNLTVSVPVIWSDFKVKDNWTPTTAPNYKEYLSGSAFGYGLNLSYSFQPKFIIKDKHFSMNIGAGYFNQRFDVIRPFNYNSMVFIIFYTDHYSYHCFQGNIGLTYNWELPHKFLLSSNFTYGVLKSFKQKYSPTRSDYPTQSNTNQIDFGKMASVSVGLNKYLGESFSVGLHLLIPIYTGWRNDEIFDDDPSTFSRPDLSIGSVISITYYLKKHQP